MAPLPRRPALLLIATILNVVGLLFLVVAVGLLIVGLYLAIRSGSARGAAIYSATIPSFVGGVLAGIIWIAVGEGIHLALGIETRLHEISKNTAR